MGTGDTSASLCHKRSSPGRLAFKRGTGSLIYKGRGVSGGTPSGIKIYYTASPGYFPGASMVETFVYLASFPYTFQSDRVVNISTPGVQVGQDGSKAWNANGEGAISSVVGNGSREVQFYIVGSRTFSAGLLREADEKFDAEGYDSEYKRLHAVCKTPVTVGMVIVQSGEGDAQNVKICTLPSMKFSPVEDQDGYLDWPVWVVTLQLNQGALATASAELHQPHSRRW